jgi:hypothetical protein
MHEQTTTNRPIRRDVSDRRPGQRRDRARIAGDAKMVILDLCDDSRPSSSSVLAAPYRVFSDARCRRQAAQPHRSNS